MQSTELFKVYSSSAGSGKTFTLAKEYIKLLLTHAEPFYFKKILAVTFTNDAANEMKVRILEYLETLAYSEDLDEKKIEKRDFLLGIFLKEINENGNDFSVKTIQLRAKEAFSYIIHHYSDFSVSTIDSFIQKIVSAFAIQLGYLNNIEIILDSEEILLPAAENFIAKVGDETEASLSDAIIDYVNQLAEEGKSWNNLPKSFSDFAKSLFSDSKLKYLEKIEDLSIESIKEISMQIFDYLRDTESNIKEITGSFIDLCVINGLEAGDFLLGSRASILAVMIKRNAGIDIFKEFSDTVKKVETGEWYAKSAKNKHASAIIDTISSVLLDIFQEYKNVIKTEESKYILLKAIHQHLFKLSLLRQFKIEIEQIKSDNGYVHISEFNKAILNVVSNEPVPYIYERIGEKYNHIMIDEFQDTSPIQFQNFLPLFANSLAINKSCMIVGDPKQAIYRFRGGDMTQIIHLYNKNIEVLKAELNPESFLIDNLDQIKPHLKEESLQVNYRSFEEIIDFNNELFGFIRNHQSFQSEFPLLEKAFDESFIQEKPSNVKSGATIQIVFKNEVEPTDFDVISTGKDDFENGENFDSESTTNKTKFEDPQLLKIINKSLDDGFVLNDIAILCRRKIVAKGIANYLKNNGIPIISSDSILLSFSNAINFVVDLMEITTANNQLIRYQTLCHFHKFILNGEIPANEGFIKELVENEDVLPLFSYFNSHGFEIDSQLVTSYSLYELAEYLIYSFRLLENKSEQEYLFAFLDEILSFKNRKSNSVHEFIEYWHLNKSKLSINSKGKNAVTITTIHKSKGLQYPIVLVPEATWAFKMLHFDSIWVHLDGVDYEEFRLENTTYSLKIATLSPKKELNQTQIKAQYNAEEELYFLEAINMLYVATTRAIERLYIFTKHSFSDKKIAEIKANKSKISDASIKNIGDLFCHFLDRDGKFNFDENEYTLKEGITAKKSITKETKEFESIFLSNYNFEKSSRLRVSSGKLNVLDSEIYLEKGNKIHKILADIISKSDIESAVNKAITIGEISFDEKNLFENNLNNLVNLPDLAQYFEEGVNAKNEMEILLPDGNAYRPDRVNFAKNETTIIDYKTGQERPEYSSQLRHYGILFAEMGFPSPKKMLVYLDELKVVEVV
jgi:ATP-dependent helicase/nuclease subunit A